MVFDYCTITSPDVGHLLRVSCLESVLDSLNEIKLIEVIVLIAYQKSVETLQQGESY